LIERALILFAYKSKFSNEVVKSTDMKISEMSRAEFIEEYETLAAKVIDAEKHTPIAPAHMRIIYSGKPFSVARGYTEEEINDYQRLLYLMGRERPAQFMVEKKPYTYQNIPLKTFGKSDDGKGRPRPDTEWLWSQWTENPGPEADFLALI